MVRTAIIRKVVPAIATMFMISKKCTNDLLTTVVYESSIAKAQLSFYESAPLCWVLHA